MRAVLELLDAAKQLFCLQNRATPGVEWQAEQLSVGCSQTPPQSKMAAAAQSRRFLQRKRTCMSCCWMQLISAMSLAAGRQQLHNIIKSITRP